VLVVFYPWSFTQVCTGEMSALRDQLADFQNPDVALLAISCDAPATQRVFAEKEGLTFPVLSDFWPHGEVARRYGVFDETLGAAMRGTFIVDGAGILRWSVVHGLRDARDLDDYRAALAEL
jgi:peroxiredoxin